MSDKAQTIFRVEKNADNPFVMIDRRTIENPKLSWKAKGLLAYLLSRPDDWVVRFRDLVKRAPDGAHTVRAALKELRDAGHVKVIQEREEGHVKQWIYKVYEVPLLVDFQQVENQQVENRTFNNKNSNKNNSTKKKLIINPITAQIFMDTFGQFNSQNEQTRWQTIYDSIGPDRAKEIIAWVFKKEIHLANRPSLIDSIETAAKKWKSGPAYKQSAAQSGDRNKYVEGEYADFIEH